jgi:hypothetical protein
MTVNMAIRTLKIFDPSLSTLSRVVIRQRLLRIFCRQNIVIRQITHKAQGIIFDQNEVDGFNNYVKEKMKQLNIGFKNICNFDDTNVPFSLDGNVTLNR